MGAAYYTGLNDEATQMVADLRAQIAAGETDIDRELFFAVESITYDHPATVNWLAACCIVHQQEVQR
jgi:hypothetical protein